MKGRRSETGKERGEEAARLERRGARVARKVKSGRKAMYYWASSGCSLVFLVALGMDFPTDGFKRRLKAQVQPESTSSVLLQV